MEREHLNMYEGGSSGEGEEGKGQRDRESVGKGGREGLRREEVTKRERGEVE